MNKPSGVTPVKITDLHIESVDLTEHGFAIRGSSQREWPVLSQHDKARIANAVAFHDQLDSMLREHGGRIVILPSWLLGVAIAAAAILGALGALGATRLLSP